MQRINHNRFNEETWDRIYKVRDSLAAYKRKVQPYPLLTKEPLTDIENRLNNLEAISAEPGRTPRHYQDELTQIKGQMLYIQNKLQEQIKKRKGHEVKAASDDKGIEI